MLFGALCALPVVLALWFAPALVVFQDCAAGRRARRRACARPSPTGGRSRSTASCCSSTAACCRAAVAALIAALAPREAAPAILMLVLLPYLALLVATLHISDYVSYRDIFHPDELPAPRDEAGTGASP